MSTTYNAGGWGGTGRFQMQRVDQGQDFEIEQNGWITAPGDCEVIAHAADAAFPGGFGNPYAIVRVTSGRFAVGNGEWYVGHCNANVAPVGTKLKLGGHIARANNSLNPGWGWCELGKWDNGPHPMGEGTQWASLFGPLVVTDPFKALSRGSKGIRVLKLTRRLAYIRSPRGEHGPYLPRAFWRFTPVVELAVKSFQRQHKLTVDGVVGVQTFEKIQQVFARQRQNRA